MYKTNHIEGVDTDRDEFLDVTERIDCYETGKVFGCDCGQDIGVKMEVAAVRCATCGKICVDRKSNDREPPRKEEEQSTLSQWT